MPSHAQMSGNSSSKQAQPPEQTPENALFSKITLSFLPFFDGMDEISNSTVYLLDNLKGRCDVLSDFALGSEDPHAVVEFKARSLAHLYDDFSNQLGVAIELVEIEAVQHAKLHREKEQLQKRLFSMERELTETITTNKKYDAQIQELEAALTISSSKKQRGYA